MQVPRPPAIGDQSVVKSLRPVLFSESILGAVRARPKGYLWTALAPALGWWAPYLARRATDPLPPTLIYVALTSVDMRLFSKPGLRDQPFEIGRWKKGSYRALASETRLGLRIDLELERLGQVRLYAGRDARPVFDLIVQSASQ